MRRLSLACSTLLSNSPSTSDMTAESSSMMSAVRHGRVTGRPYRRQLLLPVPIASRNDITRLPRQVRTEYERPCSSRSPLPHSPLKRSKLGIGERTAPSFLQPVQQFFRCAIRLGL
jgi:hypothetical protein